LTNPYNAPTADLSRADGGAATYDPQMLSLSGRIGRCRYIAYSMGVTLLLGVVAAILMGIGAAIGSSTLVSVLAVIVVVPAMAISFVMGKRRFNDMNHSGWLTLLTLIPLVNFFVALWLIFGSGDAGANQYGPAPSKNSTFVVVVACFLPVIFVVGILAAIALPAYQGYVLKAKAAQQEQSAPLPAAPQQ
jgi:uncharacterized membrane protein YhaH (DUF805 family)